MDHKEILRLAYIRDNSDLSPEKAARLFEKEFAAKYSVDSLDEDDAETAKILLERDANRERTKFNAEKQEFLKAPQQPDAAMTAEQKEFLDNYVPRLEQALENFTGITFQFGEGEEFSISTSDLKKVQAFATKPESFYMQMFQSAESPEQYFQNLVTHFWVLDNLDMILSEVYQQGVNYGDESRIKKIKGVPPKGGKRPAGAPASDNRSYEDKLFDASYQAIHGKKV